MKRAVWLTLGRLGTVGDTLLYDVTRALFDGWVDLSSRSVNESTYVRARPRGLPLRAHPSYGARYTDCRFAFGKRLHGWLPFLAFDKPAAFIGMAARRGMPRDYFGSDELLCDVPRANGLSTAQLDVMADAMIAKLGHFIATEDALKVRIKERREELWQQLQGQVASFTDALL